MKRQRTRKRPRWKYQTKAQYDDFWSRYDFSYAPGLIKNASSEITNISRQSQINQIIIEDGKEIKMMLPCILRRAIKDVYQTPFHLLEKFGRQQLQK